MKNYFEEIEKKLKENLKFEKLEIVDNSFKHKGHKFYSPEKFHLKINIWSSHLFSLSRIDAQKKIMKVLEQDLKTKIHALEINIQK